MRNKNDRNEKKTYRVKGGGGGQWVDAEGSGNHQRGGKAVEKEKNVLHKSGKPLGRRRVDAGGSGDQQQGVGRCWGWLGVVGITARAREAVAVAGGGGN
jgi:hypothetical protein